VTTATLLRAAREYTEQNLTDDVMFGHIAPPVANIYAYPWAVDEDVWSRYFEGTLRSTGGVGITIKGQKFETGGVDRHAAIDSDQLDAAGLRALAALALDTADDLDRLDDASN
jgi:hypothetical protein